MPRTIEFADVNRYNSTTRRMKKVGGGPYPVATEEELLEFANKLRAAGEATALEALLPSTPSNQSTCLIARALNFSCIVTGYTDEYDGGLPHDGDGFPADGEFRYVWQMVLPLETDEKTAQKLADAVGVPLVKHPTGEFALAPLPAHIGNAADAFDENLAFTEFIDPTFPVEDDE